MNKIILILGLICGVISQNQLIYINQSNIEPEGLEYLSGRGFLISSLTSGQVYSVTDAGVPTIFSNNAPSLISSFGLHVDNPRGVLHVCNSNYSSIARASVGDFGGPFYSGNINWIKV